MNSLVASLTGRKNPLFSTLISLTLFGILSQCRSLRPLENGKDEIPVCRCHDKDSVIITPARFDVISGGYIGRDSLTFDEWRNVLGYGCKVPERIPPCDSIRSIIANCLVGDSIQVYDLRTMHKQPKPTEPSVNNVLSVMPDRDKSFFGICADSVDATLFNYYNKGGWGLKPQHWLGVAPNDTTESLKSMNSDGMRLLTIIAEGHRSNFDQEKLLVEKNFYDERKNTLDQFMKQLNGSKSYVDFYDYIPTDFLIHELIDNDVDPDFGGPYVTISGLKEEEGYMRLVDITWNDILKALGDSAYSKYHDLLLEIMRQNCYSYQGFYNALEEKRKALDGKTKAWSAKTNIPCPYDPLPYDFIAPDIVKDQLDDLRRLLSDLGNQVNGMECNPVPVDANNGDDRCFGISSQGLITLIGEESSCDLTGSIRITDQKGSLIHSSNSGNIIGYDIGQYCTVPGSYNVLIALNGSTQTLVFIKH